MSRICMLSVFAVLLAGLALNARADTIIGFESPTYTNGANLTGQDGWTTLPPAWGVPFVSKVDNTDASSGSQSLMGNGNFSGNVRALNDSYAVGTTVYLSVDIKNQDWVGFYDSALTTRIMEFGVDISGGSGFYVGGGTGAWQMNVDTTPTANTWVTLWAKLYDGGAGNQMADVGWFPLGTGTPFVTGLKVTGYDAKDNVFAKVGLYNRGPANRIDNLFISNTAPVPEPSTLVLLAAGLVGLLCYAWRKQR